MLWGSWRWSPSNIPRDPPGLRSAIANHVQDIGSRHSGRLIEWDVLNEPYSENDYTNLLGREAMLDWFRAARSADPNAKLYLNDYPNPSDSTFINFDADVLRFLVQNGAPAVYRDLVFNQWWSDVTGTTDAVGHFTSRVFQGHYDIHVTKGNKTKIVETTLSHGQSVQSLNIVFD